MSDAAEIIRDRLSEIASAADQVIGEGGTLEQWQRRVLAILGLVGTRLPVGEFGRRPKFFDDLPVREHLIALHRETTVAKAVQSCRSRFGAERSPSRSAIARFWLYLDHLQGRKSR